LIKHIFGLKILIPNLKRQRKLLTGISLCLFCYAASLTAQNLPLHPEAIFPEEYKIISNPKVHTSILPYLTQNDSIFSQRAIHFSRKNATIFFTPVLTGIYKSTSDDAAFHAAFGINSSGNWGKLFTFGARYSLHYLSIDSNFYSGLLPMGKVIPHYARYASKNGNNYLLNDFCFNLTLHPSKYIDVEGGIGKHHIGDGYRSLFLSSNAAPYPYFKTSFHFWNIHYFSMITSMKDFIVSKDFENIYKKYVALHYLSWNVTKSLNFNLFEAVIWERADTLSKRSLDIHYLNPVIFYRPVEYNLGSPDNVIIGLGSRINLLPNIRLYGQFLLDEFYLKEVKAGKKWWGNKYGYQAGVKIYNPFGINPMIIQTEYNQCRPYTYSHSSQLQNYGNWLQPLAHPLGANFREFLFIGRYGYRSWSLHSRSIISWQGMDENINGNIGSDIYKSNSLRDHDYNNYLLQGKRSDSFMQELKLVRTLVRSWGLQAELTGSYLITKQEMTQYRYFISFGFRTLIFEEDNLP
jgi:hypothetical protein